MADKNKITIEWALGRITALESRLKEYEGYLAHEREIVAREKQRADANWHEYQRADEELTQAKRLVEQTIEIVDQSRAERTALLTSISAVVFDDNDTHKELLKMILTGGRK